ncbi:Isopenicillin N synthase [Artemisia annua]|uniref:Isopenicillin N synthase n=1 Tax=Artemisia annua TaxID=35608 RepID=A0A2U1LY85_ARTAN|nr:Isopenicillin N synthase [Artemisia annua]
MGSLDEGWPEPVVCVQSLSDSGELSIPDRYIKPQPERPSLSVLNDMDIPIIDFNGLVTSPEATMKQISKACREWGFFQLVNHGVRTDLVDGVRETWREFFHEPMEVKQKYANSPKTYEGFGSRLGTEKGAILDWSDYYYLHYRPPCNTKWPDQPPSLSLLRAISTQTCPLTRLELGVDLSFLVSSGAKWPSYPVSKSVDSNVRKMNHMVLSNAIYKSVEHRVVVNPNKERVSLAYFYNPKSDMLIQPISELVTSKKPALYLPMTFEEYRRFIRTKGPQGKFQVESLKSPR